MLILHSYVYLPHRFKHIQSLYSFPPFLTLCLFLSLTTSLFLSFFLSFSLSFSLFNTEDGDKAVTSNSTTSGKSRLASSESDVNLYLTPQGLTRDCWARLGEPLKTIFGPPDLVEEKENADEIESGSVEKKVI